MMTLCLSSASLQAVSNLFLTQIISPGSDCRLRLTKAYSEAVYLALVQKQAIDMTVDHVNHSEKTNMPKHVSTPPVKHL